MSGAESLTLRLVLHDGRLPRAILVSRDGQDGPGIVSLPKAEISWRAVKGDYVANARGLKLQRIEVTLPGWLARDRGLG